MYSSLNPLPSCPCARQSVSEDARLCTRSLQDITQQTLLEVEFAGSQTAGKQV